MNSHRAAASLTLSFACVFSLFAQGCVSQRAYGDLAEEKRLVNLELQDLKSFIGQLESDNERLQGELDIYKASGPIEASYTKEIDERIDELNRLSQGIAGSDITLLTVEGGYGLRLDDSVLFDSGSATLKPEGALLLGRMVTDLKPGSFRRIWVRGHTDGDPVTRPETLANFPGGNLELSAARAVAVAGQLVVDGIPGDKIVVAGFGSNDPVVQNDSTENKRKNRRVEIFVLDAEEDGEAQ